MQPVARSLTPRESRIVLDMTARGAQAVNRGEIIDMLGAGAKAADRMINSLRRKGWLERASWGRYLLVPPEMGPDALGHDNVLALADRIASPYYFGYATAARHYGFTTQHRFTVELATPARVRNRRLLDTDIRIVNLSARKFFGFRPVDAFGYTVSMSDREKTVIDCIDRPRLAGGEGEAAVILARACRRLDWEKAAGYLDRIGSKTLARRFGWLADHAEATMPDDARARLREMAQGGGRSVFGPEALCPDAIGYRRDWNLVVNVSDRVLLDSEGIARRKSLPSRIADSTAASTSR